MIKIENVVTPSPEQWEAIIRGMRNPMNSRDRMDSAYDEEGNFVLGANDLSLAKRLARAGSDHRKYLRQIFVSVDITAPLYWWKEYDTYKVGTVANSCSTMHKIHEKEFTLDDFSHEHLMDCHEFWTDPRGVLGAVIDALNACRNAYIESGDKKYWWQMIQLLPSSYNQMRTCTLNYENLLNIYHARRNHKLDEWVDFCKRIEDLPYSELITGAIT